MMLQEVQNVFLAMPFGISFLINDVPTYSRVKIWKYDKGLLKIGQAINPATRKKHAPRPISEARVKGRSAIESAPAAMVNTL